MRWLFVPLLCLSAAARGQVDMGPGPNGTGSGSGTVTTTGSPSSGNLAKFSGSTSVTNTDLTGDVTTSGGPATTLAHGNAGNLDSGTLPVARLPLATNAAIGGGRGDGQTVTGVAGVFSTLATDTLHTTTGTTANIGGQDDYSGSSLTATLAALTAGQSLLVTDQNSTALTLALAGQTVVGLPSPTSLNNGGFYAFTYNSAGTLSGYGFPGFGTITSGALMKFNGPNGSSTAGDLSGDCTTAGALVISCTKIGGDANIAFLDVSQAFTKGQAVTPFALTDASSITVDASQSNNFSVTLAGNRTLANPTNLKAGQVVTFTITQDGTGSRTLAYGGNYNWMTGVAPTLNTAAAAKTVISCFADTSSTLQCAGGAPVGLPLAGTTGSIGGGALLAGACTSGTVTITGATTAMVPTASPVTYPGDGFDWASYVSSANTVTVKVCGFVAGTPTASAYNVRLIQ